MRLKVQQEEKILNEPAEIYWFNEILFVILSGFKNGLSGLQMAPSDLQGQMIIRMVSVESKWLQQPLNGLSGLQTASNDLRGQVVIKMASVSPF